MFDIPDSCFVKLRKYYSEVFGIELTYDDFNNCCLVDWCHCYCYDVSPDSLLDLE